MKNNPLISIGIDWADADHVFHLMNPSGPVIGGTFKQDPQAIEEVIDDWRKRFPNATFAIAIETTKGPLISALLEYKDVVIYPVNPAALANYRKAFTHGGGKNDPADAMLLAQYLEHYLDQLRPLRHDEPLTRELASLAEDRRRLVDQRTAHCNELKALLKRYFPVILQLKAAKTYAGFILRFLVKYPTLTDAQAAGEHQLRKFFYGVGAPKKVEDRVRLIVAAIPLSNDAVLLRSSARRATALCKLLETYNGQVDLYDADIKELVQQHADYTIAASLPGGSYTTQCRLIAAMGDDRTRFSDASSLQAASGIAPLTKQSGKTKFVCSRWACSKFMKQTFHEFAGMTIKQSKWASAYYKQQRDKGKSAQMAKRALAFKWQRIIHRCWQDRVPYDEQRYIERLRATGSPLITLMDK
jgi:transposase